MELAENNGPMSKSRLCIVLTADPMLMATLAADQGGAAIMNE